MPITTVVDSRHPAKPAWPLAVLALSTLLASLGTSSANIALPALQTAFSATYPAVQWVVVAYLLAMTSLVVGAGKAGDVLGRRRLLLWGVALFTLASALCAAAPSLPLLIAARALQGAGAAAMMALTMALVAETVPKDKVGSAMGMLGTMSAVGTALGPSLGGALISQVGWPAIFLINVPLGVATLVLGLRWLPPASALTPSPTARFDHAGTILLAIALGTYALGMTMKQGLLLALAAAVLALFLLVEQRAAAPLIPLALFAEPRVRAGFAMSALVTSVVMATLVVGPFYLTAGLGLGAGAAGLAMACGPVVSALAGVPAGALVDRYGSGRIVSYGLSAVLAGSALLALLPTAAGVTGYVAALALLTAGYALFQAANNTGVMQQVGAVQRGTVAGMLNLARNLGLISGAAMMGMIFALGADAASGMRLTFGCAAALSGGALLIAVGRRAQGRGGQR